MGARVQKKAEDALLLALACGSSAEAAAQKCGLSDRTVHRRLSDPAFRQRVQQMRTELVSRTAGALTAASTEATRTLLDLLKSPSPATVRLGAARAILETGVKLREAAETDARLVALEQQIADLLAANATLRNGTHSGIGMRSVG